MGASTIPAGGGGGLQPKYQKFTTSGTFTLPDGYGVAKPLLIQIQAIGGGGGSFTNTKSATFNGNGGYRNYFGEGQVNAGTFNWTGANNGRGGGSGGLCSTQLYLTSALTITIGAAGTRDTTNLNSSYSGANDRRGDDYANWNVIPTGGTGGTTTAGVLQATGGGGAVLNGMRVRSIGGETPNATGFFNFTMASHGNGGIPAGTAGGTSPLLGTIAGGSGDTTPVRGSFGVGGISTDGTTSTGTDGSGAGANSIGASGAVIITWWQ